MAIQRKAISGNPNKQLGKSNGRTSTDDDKVWLDEIEKKKVSQHKQNKQQNNTITQTTPQTSSALNAANQTTYTVPKEKLQIKSNLFNDTKESEGLTGVAKDQMNYIVNKGKEVLDSRKKEFENWYTPDKQTLLFNDDGSLKDVKGELDAVNSQIRGNITKLKFDEYKALNDKKKQLEEAVKYSDYLIDQNTADNLTEKRQIKRFYTLQDAYNDTFGERALKTVGSSLTSIVNTPFELYDVAKEFVTQGKEKANAEGNISKIINNDIQNLNEEIYYNTNAAEQFALQTVGGVSQFLAHLGLAAFTGGGANMALATMSLQSGTEKAYQNIEEGYDVNTAILNGVMTGAMTALTEKLPIDNVIKIANSGLAQFSLAAIGSQALSEGLEEGVEYLTEPLIDKLTLGKNIEYDPGELFMAMALGMSSGTIIGLGANAIPTIKSTRSANQLKADMNTLLEYQKVNNLTPQEKTVFDQVIGLAQSAINRFEGKSVIGDAVKLSGDVVTPLSANEVSQNLKQALQPGLDMNTRIAEQMNTFKSIMNNAQNMLNMKGINMDATQYAFLDENVKNQVDKVQNYANELNVPVVFDVNMDSTGMYYNGVVYVNPESNLAPLTTFVHELTHGSESSKYYDSLSNLFTGNKNLSDELQTIKEKYAQHDIKLNDDEALKEYVAIQTQDSLGNEKFVDRLVKYNNSLAYRIYAGIKNIVSKTNTMQDIEYNLLKSFRDRGIDVNIIPQYSFIVEDGSELTLTHEQALENASKVLSMDPVAIINENKNVIDNKKLTEKINEFFNSINNVAYNPIIGNISLDKYGTNALVSHFPRYIDKYAAVAAIPEVLNKGEIIRVENNWKERGKDTVIIVAPIIVNGNEKYMSAVVEQFNGRNGLHTRYYLHELVVLDKEKATNTLHTDHFSGKQDVVAFTYNILNEAANVNNRAKDLLAIHNLKGTKLKDSVELGGLVMPSIAVTKDTMPHEQFGEYSAVFDKSSIDPQIDDRNKVYSRDAWTPTYPYVDYKANEEVQNKIRDLYYQLKDKIGFEEARPLYTYATDLEGELNSEKGEANLIKYVKEDTDLQQLYLTISGYGKVENITKEIVYNLSDNQVTINDYILNNLSTEALHGYKNISGDTIFQKRKNYSTKYGDEVKRVYADALISKGQDAESANNKAQNMNLMDITSLIRRVNDYAVNGKTKITYETDYDATRKAIGEAAKSNGYDQWVEDLFRGAEEKKGIRNDVDTYTRSGNKRSFDKLHDEYNAENILNAMLNKKQTAGVSFGSGLNTMMAAQAKEFDTINDIIASENNLQNNNASKEIHDQLTNEFDSLRDEARTMYRYEPSGFNYLEQFANASVETARIDNPSINDVVNSFNKYDFEIDDTFAQKMIDLNNQLKNLPTDYFEAKPQRIVTPNEWKQVYAPNTIDPDLKNQLVNMGIEVIEYDPNVEGDRQNKINQYAGKYKFSYGMTPDDIKVKENLKKFEDSIQIEENYFSEEEFDNLLNGKISDGIKDKTEKVKKIMVDKASEWIPNYDILRKKYGEFSDSIFNEALYEELIFGSVDPETKNNLKKDLMKYMADEETFNDTPIAKKRIDSLLDDAIEYFSADAKYQSNKNYMGSIASKVNKLLKGYSGLAYGQIEQTYNQVEALKKADAMLEAKKMQRMKNNQDVVASLLAFGKDNKSYFKTLEQNLDSVAGGNVDLRYQLRETLEYKKFLSQNEYVKTLNKYNALIDDLVKSGITEGSKESKAMQWLLEGKKEDGSSYDLPTLRVEYDYMLNGKKAYQVIEDGAKRMREAYDEIFRKINSQREDIYGDVELRNEIDTQEYKSKALQAKKHMENVRKQFEKNPSAELQATLDKAEKDYRIAARQYDAKVAKDDTKDSTRRQKLPYRKNYAHHVIDKKGFGRKIIENITGVKQVPTALAGISDYAEPKSGFANFFKRRDGGSYDADAVKGFAEYIQDAARVIAYDPYIDYIRDFTSDIRVSAEGDNMSQFVRYLTNYANDLAGKTNFIDRPIRELMGDKKFAIVKTLNDRVKANAILGNVRTAVTQIFNIPNAIGIINDNGGIKASYDIMKGTANYLGSLMNLGGEDLSAQSPFIQSRYFETDTGVKGLKATAENMAQFMLTKGDEISTKMIWNAAYQQALRKGEEFPVFYADDLTRRSVAGRSVGEVPIALQSKVLNLMIPFQVETNNAFRTMASMAKNPRSWMSLLTILLADWLFNELSENLYGDRILFDPIDVIYDSITSGKDTKDIGLRLGGELLSAIPGGSYFPMLFGLSEDDTEKYFGESDPSRYGTGNMGLSVIGDATKNILDGKYLDAASDLIANFALPGGGKQTQRTIEALQVNGMLPQYQNGQLVNEPIHYTGSGKVGFVNNPEAIMDNPSNFIDFAKQVLFGKWAGKNAQEYINSNFNGLGSDKQNDMFKELAQSLSPIDAYNAVKGINQAKEDSISSSDNDTSNDELLSEFDSKKEELSGKRDSKTKFIDYITSSDYTSEQKNYIFDEYYGDSNLATFINDFAESKNLDDETIYNMKSLTSTAEGVEGSNGKSIKNSKSLKVRKELEQLGVYDDFVQYIYKNDLDPSTFGLNDSVMEMSNADFNYNYQNIYGEAYTSKSNEQLMQEAYAATFGKTSPSLTKQQKALQKAYDEEMKKRENFKKDLAKIANGTSTKSNYKNVNSILQSALKNTKSNSIKTSNSDFVDDLIKKYKEDHPYDNLFS